MTTIEVRAVMGVPIAIEDGHATEVRIGCAHQIAAGHVAEKATEIIAADGMILAIEEPAVMGRLILAVMAVTAVLVLNPRQKV